MTDIGALAIDRPTGGYDPGYTDINLTNPANMSGTITSVDIYAVSILYNFIVGIFYLVSGTTYKCRSIYSIGTVSAGLNTYPVSLIVRYGDYIGHYYEGGKIEASTSEEGGIYDTEGNYVQVDSEHSYELYAGHATSCYGKGLEGMGNSVAISPYMML